MNLTVPCTASPLPEHCLKLDVCCPQEQNTDIVKALAGDMSVLEIPDNSGLLPLGLAVAWNYLDVARTILPLPE